MRYTVEQVTEAMKDAVREKGENYVYPLAGGACFYADPETGAPSCIVGHVLAKIDPKGFKALAEYEAEGRRSSTARSVFAGLTVPDIERQDDVIADALREAQSSQDRGDTWGVAYAEFEVWLARHDENV